MAFKMGELLGWAGGWLLAPAAAVGSALRRARLLHPAGVLYKARVEPIARGGALGAAAARLDGDAIIRLSSALWRGGKELPDVLGFAIRIQGPRQRSAEPEPGDQDILFATIRHPSTMLLAPLTTNPHSFLCNDYYGVSPFEVEGLGRAWLRVTSPRAAAEGERRAAGENKLSRDEELRRAVDRGTATFGLEVRRRRLGGAWQPVASIHLLALAPIDQAALRFSPFQADRGVVPRGFVHALRRGVYRASQRARPAASGDAGSRA
jgi:hypothetical protein